MSWTLCTSGAAILKAGKQVNDDISSGVVDTTDYSNAIEGDIEVQTKRSWIANFATQTSGMQGLLSGTAAAGIANQMIGYDMTGYLGTNARTLMDLNDDTYTKGIRQLKQFDSIDLSTP